jgi:hypothetical protein
MGRQDAIVFKDGFIALNAGIGVPVASGGHGGRGTEQSRGGGEIYGAIWEEDGQSRGLVVTLSFFSQGKLRRTGHGPFPSVGPSCRRVGLATKVVLSFVRAVSVWHKNIAYRWEQ